MKLSIGQVSKEIGVSVDTLRRWEREGKIKSERTQGKHRRYDLELILAYVNRNKPTPKITVAYARVSTPNKKNDLETQKKGLELFCLSNGWQYILVSDIGSGLNYTKKGLKELIKMIELNQVERLVINYKDRLLCFGNEIIFEMCKYHNVEVVVITESESKDYNKELVEDVLAVITLFSARIYGSRSHKSKKIIEESKKLFEMEGDIGGDSQDSETI